MTTPNYPARTITPAPERLVENGKYNLGCFNSPVKEANLLDIPSSNNFIPPLLKYVQLREWQAFQVKNEEYFVMMALYNAKKMALVQFILYNFKTKEKFKYEKQVFTTEISVPNSLYDTTGSYHSDNMNMDVYHNIATKKLSIRVKIENLHADLPDVEASFEGIHDVDKYTPMVVCNPFSDDSVMYSHKCLMVASGEVKLTRNNARTITFSPDSTCMILDEHKGYYPFITRYDWVTSLGKTAMNQLIGFNLTKNQVLHAEQYNENCLWLDGKLYPLPPITITRLDTEKGLGTGKWFIQDEYDMVKLEFEPSTHTFVNINYCIVQSQYNGPYGFFRGYLRKPDGEKVMIENMFGMGEDFYLRL